MILTLEEFNSNLCNLMQKFASGTVAVSRSERYMTSNKINIKELRVINLMLFALDTWEHSNTADNYLTEQLILNMFKYINHKNGTIAYTVKTCACDCEEEVIASLGEFNDDFSNDFNI